MTPHIAYGKSVGLVAIAVLLAGVCSGCAHAVNQFREDGPSVSADWDSPTAADVKARFQPAEPRRRDWETTTLAAERESVYHWPLYFEDPFEDKGHGRTDQTHPHDVYRWGWEDWVAFPYCFARFTADWLLLPVSAVVTPPWTVMESDGRVSRQLVWRDHDARPEGRYWIEPSPGATPEEDAAQEGGVDAEPPPAEPSEADGG